MVKSNNKLIFETCTHLNKNTMKFQGGNKGSILDISSSLCLGVDSKFQLVFTEKCAEFIIYNNQIYYEYFNISHCPKVGLNLEALVSSDILEIVTFSQSFFFIFMFLSFHLSTALSGLHRVRLFGRFSRLFDN